MSEKGHLLLTGYLTYIQQINVFNATISEVIEKLTELFDSEGVDLSVLDDLKDVC